MSSNGHANTSNSTSTMTENGGSRSGSDPSNLLPEAKHYQLRGGLPNSPLSVSIISALLGGLLFAPLAFAVQPWLSQLGANEWTWARPQLGVYLGCMGLFHLCEFWTTAGWNPHKLTVDAFLLNNGATYWYSHAIGLAEYFVSCYYWPSKYESALVSFPFTFVILALLLCAQALRSLAMIHAAESFSHVVKAVKHDDHTLVTRGVYAYSRHPSYCGFFYWAVLTQALLGNVASTIAFVFILGNFFVNRIKDEEKFLVRFFGNDYIEYRKKVGTGLPFPIPA